MAKPQCVVMISGNGSNLQAMIEAGIPISGVISNRANAFGLVRAQLHGIATRVLSSGYSDTELLQSLEHFKPDWIVLSGFMKMLSPDIIQAYPERIINIHPSLLPKYPGLKTYQRALADGECEHGTSVHYVTTGLDTGPIIAQASLPIHANDTVETLKARTQALEHALYPKIIQKLMGKNSASSI